MVRHIQTPWHMWPLTFKKVSITADRYEKLNPDIDALHKGSEMHTKLGQTLDTAVLEDHPEYING